MARAILIVLDSFGIGGAPDAAQYRQIETDDFGSDTFGHIAAACASGKVERNGHSGPLRLPNLTKLGLIHAHHGATGKIAEGFDAPAIPPMAKAGHAAEISKGKDTPSGHWEIAGLPVTFDWGYFPRTVPAMPMELLDHIYASCGLEGSLCNAHGSGTDVIAQFGEEHVKTGKPIFYTSNDSVFQIAAHEDPSIFGYERLLDVCRATFDITSELNIGRVIARPFVGSHRDDFERTGNRRDFAIPPTEPTLLDRAKEAGRQVISVGKISDIYAGSGITDSRKASGNEAIYQTTLGAIADARDGDLVFSNFVDFDMLFGHRRDVAGYAHALETFDAWIPGLIDTVSDGDLILFTADHGCDPTWSGTDHTREQVPVLAYIKGQTGEFFGQRSTFADMGESIAAHLGLPSGKYGKSFL
jgi:phosphopentomutase